MRPLLAIVCLLLSGCPKAKHVAQPAAPIGAGEQVAASAHASNTAQAAADAASSERLAKVRANVDAAATAPNIEAAPVAVNELTVAQGRLADVQPDPAEVAAAAERRALVEAGKAEEARANALAAAKAGEQLSERIRQLEADASTLRAERDRIAADFAAQAERNRVENQKAIDAALADAKKAQDKQHNAMLQSQAEKLTWIGIGCISAAVALAALIGFFGSLLVLRKVGLYIAALALVGFLFLGAAQIVSQWWFMRACAGAILIGCIWFGVWAWRHQKRGDLAEELQARTAKVAAVATTTVPILDAAYESASGDVKAWLDTHIFDRLSSAMNGDTKAAVHAIRAEEKADT